MGIADPLLPNLDFGQTPATPRRSRTRPGGRGLDARFRVPDAPLKRCGARIRLRPPAPDRQPRLGEVVGGESPEGFQRSHNAHGSPCCGARPGPRGASVPRGLSSSAWLGPGAEPEGPWRGNKAHGRIECRITGNGGATSRTRQRSNALELAASRSFDRFVRHATSVTRRRSADCSTASAVGPLASPALGWVWQALRRDQRGPRHLRSEPDRPPRPALRYQE
jgi:hypothetical protein